jgi:hypothetical protein
MGEDTTNTPEITNPEGRKRPDSKCNTNKDNQRSLNLPIGPQKFPPIAVTPSTNHENPYESE